MKENELKNARPDDAGLDAALAQMADEVPPMPADFHDRWMNAVRAEAAKAAPAAENNESHHRTVSIVRWTRILSAAAAFVFLIGGTLLYRNSKKSLSVPYTAEMRETAESAAAPAEDAEEAPADAGEDREEAPVMMSAAVQADAVEAEESAEAADDSVKAAGAALNAVQAAPKSASMAAGADMEESAYDMEAAEAEYGVVYEAAEEPEPTVAPTAVPTAEPTAVPEPTAEPTPEPTAEPGFLQQAGSFFADMGDFLLAALPYLLVLAVPAAAALIIRRKKTGK